jgi:hypothetical protein
MDRCLFIRSAQRREPPERRPTRPERRCCDAAGLVYATAGCASIFAGRRWRPRDFLSAGQFPGLGFGSLESSRSVGRSRFRCLRPSDQVGRKSRCRFAEHRVQRTQCPPCKFHHSDVPSDRSDVSYLRIGRKHVHVVGQRPGVVWKSPVAPHFCASGADSANMGGTHVRRHSSGEGQVRHGR